MPLRIPEAKDVAGKKVLVRVDFNVPMKDGTVTDDTRIKAHLETLKFLRDSGAFISLVSHLGRPKEGRDPEFSLKPVADHLGNVTGWKVRFVPDCIGVAVEEAVASQSQDEIWSWKTSVSTRRRLKTIHPLPKSSHGPSRYSSWMPLALPIEHTHQLEEWRITLSPLAGFLVKKEIEALSVVRDNPMHPYVLILGGAKVSDKIGVIENLLSKVDHIVIGGGMAYTFLKAKGHGIGKSLCEEDKSSTPKKCCPLPIARGSRFICPLIPSCR